MWRQSFRRCYQSAPVNYESFMSLCKIYAAPVLNYKDRRLLSSYSSAHCAGESGRLQQTLHAKEYSSGYLCRKCFNSTAKYVALKEEVKNLKKELLLKLSAISDGEPVRIQLSHGRRGLKWTSSSKAGDQTVKQAFAKHSFNSPAMRKQLLKRIKKVIFAEMKGLLKESTVTVSGASPEVFTFNAWESHYATLQRIAPFLVGILDGCIPKSSSRRQCTIATCTAVLIKSHRRSTLLHLLVSLILSSGHAAKQVCISSCITLFNVNIPFYQRCTQGCKLLVSAYPTPALLNSLISLVMIMITLSKNGFKN